MRRLKKERQLFQKERVMKRDNDKLVKCRITEGEAPGLNYYKPVKGEQISHTQEFASYSHHKQHFLLVKQNFLALKRGEISQETLQQAIDKQKNPYTRFSFIQANLDGLRTGKIKQDDLQETAERLFKR